MVSDDAESVKEAKPLVLILVLMEYGLGHGEPEAKINPKGMVLILVLMEYGLGRYTFDGIRYFKDES